MKLGCHPKGQKDEEGGQHIDRRRHGSKTELLVL